MNESTHLGLIAGAGRFPFMVAEGARRAGCALTIVGLKGFADPAIAEYADSFRWSGLAKPEAWVRTLKRRGVKSVIRTVDGN